MRKILTASVLCLALLAPAHPAHANNFDTSRKKYGAIMPDDYYDRLAQCETGGNWNHSTRSYTGGLGIHRQTFRRWSKYHSARGLTPRQQVRVADAIAFSGYTTRTGEHVWRVGPWGWGCVKQNRVLQAYICASGHPKVQRWKRGC